jgi:hypothetical protein
MRTIFRSALIAVLALLGTVALGAASALMAAVTLAATALIVPGTGTPDPSVVTGFMQNAVNYYSEPNAPSCKTICNPVPITYPASLWPLTGLSTAKWNVSVANGVSNLNSTVLNELAADPTGDIVIFGFSQGAAVASQEKSNLAGVTNKGQFYFVLVGNPERPNGGLFERLALLGTVPILDVTFGLPTSTTTGIATTDIAYQYDGVADFPEYPINGLADLNALAGIIYVHQYELAPNGKQPSPLPYGYTTTTLLAAEANPANQQVVGDTTYITIPATSLPLLDPVESLAAATGTSLLVTPLVDLTQPALQVLIETGYNRTDYGQPTPFGLIPPINPITLTTQLIAAIQQGVQDAVSNLGNPTPVPLPDPPSDPSTPIPAVSQTTTTNDLAATALQQPKTNVPAATIGDGGATTVSGTVATKPATPTIGAAFESDLHRLTTALSHPSTQKVPTTTAKSHAGH